MISAMKLLIVVGARPNFMKAAPILKAIRQFNSSLDEWAEPIAPMRQIPEKWDGKSGARIVQILAAKLMSEAPPLPALETSIAPLQKNA